MLKQLWFILSASLLALCGLSACREPAADGDADGDTDVDADSDTDGDGDADGDAWPCSQASTSRPLFRLSAVHQGPQVAPALQDILDASLDDLQSTWLIELDLEASTMRAGAGVAAGVPPTNDDEFCTVSWRTEYPAMTDIPITVEGDTVSTTDPVDGVLLPIFDMEGELLVEVNFVNVELAGLVMNESRTLIGVPHPTAEAPYQLAATWDTTATMSGWISWDEAMAITIPALGDQSFCTLRCGRDCVEVTDPLTECTAEVPEPIPNSDPEALGWHHTADIGFGAVTME